MSSIGESPADHSFSSTKTPRLAVWTVRIASLAALNYLAGRLGLLLAIPPGFATPVFPPSGIALAAVLIFGPRIWPGVFLGSFAFNSYLALSGSPGATLLGAAPVSASIAIGSSLQAVLGASMIRRWVGFPTKLDYERAISAFLLLAGPVSCLIAATWGVSTLRIAGIVPPELAIENWFTWWVGDAIGCLVFTPLVMLLYRASPIETPDSVFPVDDGDNPTTRLWRKRQRPVGIPLGIAFIAAVTLYLYASNREQNRVQIMFEQEAGVFQNALIQSVVAHTEILYSVENHLASHPSASTNEFYRFSRRILDRFPNIQAIAWAPRVIRSDSNPSPGLKGPVRIWHRDWEPASGSQRQAAFPIQWIEPYDELNDAVGIDLWSHRMIRNTIGPRLNHREPVGIPGIIAPENSSWRPDLIIAMPVHRVAPGLEHANSTPESTPLAGLVVASLHLERIVKAVTAALPFTGIDLTIMDDTVETRRRQVLLTQTGNQPPANRLALERTYTLAGRQWIFEFTNNSDYSFPFAMQAWSILVGALLFTTLLGAFLLQMTGKASAIEDRVQQRTHELRESNTQLEREIQQRREVEAELLRSNRDLDAFAYSASHDMKEPLRSIEMLSQWVAEEPNVQLSPDGRHYLEQVRIRANRLQRLLQDLLEYSRANRISTDIQTVDVRQLVEEILQLWNLPTDLQIELAPDLPTFKTHRVPLEQVLRNLLSNAIKYGLPDNPPRSIRVEARCLGDRYEFSVTDNGPGIDPRFHDRIFAMFQTLQPRSETDTTGVGLALVRKIVEAQRGSIRVESTPGHGATFTFTWPAAPSTSLSP